MMACAAENEQIHGDKQQWLGRIAILAAFCVASQVLNGGVSVRNTGSGDFSPPLCCRIGRVSVSAGPLCGCLCGLAGRIAFARSVGFVASTHLPTILRLLLRVFLVVIQAL